MIDEAAERFDLGDKAGTLLSALLALIMDRGRGSFAGFLNRFGEVGLGDTAQSWVRSGANTSLSYEQLESTLGEETLQDISNQVGLEYKKTVSASAFMIPHIVDQISPNGVVPQDDDLLSRIGGYLTEAEELKPSETFDRTGSGAVAGGSRAEGIVETTSDYQAGENTMLNWLLPLILLGFLLIIGYTFCGGRPETAVSPAPVNINKAMNVNVNK